MKTVALIGLSMAALVLAAPAFADSGRAIDNPSARMPEPMGDMQGTHSTRFTHQQKHDLIQERLELKRELKRQIKEATTDEERQALLAEQRQVEREISAILAN